MRVTIVLASYNAGAYLLPQLESLRLQTRPPDEVIIQDDGSTDGTMSLAEEYVQIHQLANWTVRSNPAASGVTSNFLSAAEAARGEIVFFCDQDDVWSSDKIERMLAPLELDPDLLALSCRTVRTNEALVPLRNKRKFSGKTQWTTLRAQVERMHSPGLALAVRSDLLREVLPTIRARDLVHDLPVGLFAASLGRYAILDEGLVLHRIHASNASAPMLTLKDRLRRSDFHIQGRRQKAQILQAVLGHVEGTLDPRDEGWLKRATELEGKRVDALEDARLGWLTLDLFRVRSGSPIALRGVNLLVAFARKYEGRL